MAAHTGPPRPCSIVVRKKRHPVLSSLYQRRAEGFSYPKDSSTYAVQ
ncbi:hypothetical protein OOU_Y34scaffold01018g6 [Pyricularia oryzae Y34]|uniref:Uncharacterized protein n=2 Tax=Pyricularia oryzae TaxID=318829 RepID=A0AA97NMK1_PYRO3|nr:hypothetical protein OOU_Y34scaffold01018g6 [Pyricularia oryzae Y34]